MSEGMSGSIKALKIVDYIQELGITPEEVAEIVDHHRRYETTHGLLWGDIANFGRETEGLKLIGLLCKILQDVEGWKDDEHYPVAIIAARLQKTQEVLA